jgi:predicted aldo/keto reductase-like oxidoreductase
VEEKIRRYFASSKDMTNDIKNKGRDWNLTVEYYCPAEIEVPAYICISDLINPFKTSFSGKANYASNFAVEEKINFSD